MKLKRLFLALLCTLIIVVGNSSIKAYANYKIGLYKASDAFARKHSVMLTTSEGSCSGVEIVVRGVPYILTAMHCRLLLKGANVTFQVVKEDAPSFQAKVVKIDSKADLMLLTGQSREGIDVAQTLNKYEKVHTMTHGAGHDNYRTDGELLESNVAAYMLFPIVSEEDSELCASDPRFNRQPTLLVDVCMVVLRNVVSTAHVVPGSSGGMVLNARGELVGIVSGIAFNDFSMFVPLADIHEFLK